MTDNEAVYHKTAAGLEIDIKDSEMDYPFKKFPHTLSWKKTLNKEESALQYTADKSMEDPASTYVFEAAVH